eukprot:55293-Prymnesium_polylepis.2
MLISATGEEAFEAHHVDVTKGRRVVQRQAAVVVAHAEQLQANALAARRLQREHLPSHLDELAVRLRKLDTVAAWEQRAAHIMQQRAPLVVSQQHEHAARAGDRVARLGGLNAKRAVLDHSLAES